MPSYPLQQMLHYRLQRLVQNGDKRDQSAILLLGGRCVSIGCQRHPFKKKPDDRNTRLFDALFSVLPCNAAVLLTLSKGGGLVPAAVNGFRTDILVW
jgi:hypothetical protein